jgi:hypothetical protein
MYIYKRGRYKKGCKHTSITYNGSVLCVCVCVCTSKKSGMSSLVSPLPVRQRSQAPCDGGDLRDGDGDVMVMVVVMVMMMKSHF